MGYGVSDLLEWNRGLKYFLYSAHRFPANASLHLDTVQPVSRDSRLLRPHASGGEWVSLPLPLLPLLLPQWQPQSLTLPKANSTPFSSSPLFLRACWVASGSSHPVNPWCNAPSVWFCITYLCVKPEDFFELLLNVTNKGALEIRVNGGTNGWICILRSYRSPYTDLVLR